MIFLLSPLASLVTSVGGGLGRLASGAIKGIAGAMGGAAKSSDEEAKNKPVKDEDGQEQSVINTAKDKKLGSIPMFDKDKEPPDMFGDLDLAKVKSTLEDAGPMGPEEEGPKTVYKVMIGVLQGISQTLLRMENTMKMLLEIEYERVKGMISQSASENITRAQPDMVGEKKRGFFGRAKDSITAGYKKATGSTWMKILGLSGLLFAMNHWEEDLKKGFTGLLKGIHGWIDDIQKDEKFIEAKDNIISKMVAVLDIIWTGIKDAAWEYMFGASGEKRIVQEANTGSTATSNMAGVFTELGERGTDIDTRGRYVDGKYVDPLSKKQRSLVDRGYQDKLRSMLEISDQSDGRIQWTGINRDMSTLLSGFTAWDHGKGLFEKLLPSEVMNANPIIDGHIFPNWDVLKTLNPGDLAKAGGITEKMTDLKKSSITRNLKKRSILANEKLEWENATVGNEPGWQWLNNMKGDDKFEQRKSNRLAEIQKDIDANLALELGQQFPDKDLQTKFFKDATTPSKDHSIFTHDNNVIKLLEPVSKSFSGDKQTPAVVMAPDNRNQSVTKLGDTYSGGLSSRVQESTAQMLAYTKNLNSTTGQFA